MRKENEKAHIIVRQPPKLNFSSSLSRVRKASPMVAIRTPASVWGLGRCRKRKKPRIGTRSTERMVMKADLEGVFPCNPSVWKKNPPRRKAASVEPRRKVSTEMFRKTPGMKATVTL